MTRWPEPLYVCTLRDGIFAGLSFAFPGEAMHDERVIQVIRNPEKLYYVPLSRDDTTATSVMVVSLSTTEDSFGVQDHVRAGRP